MKRILAILLAISLFVVAPRGAAAQERTARTTGDFSGDGMITAADAASVLRAASGLISPDAAASAIADATGDMSVAAGDAIAILLVACGRLARFSDLPAVSDDNLIGERFMEKFSYLGVVSRQNEYRSLDAAMYLSTVTAYDCVLYVADVYARSIFSLRTAFSGGAYGQPRALVQQQAIENSAILALTGDGYIERKVGPLVRNGVVYRDSITATADVCVLYRDGALRCIDHDLFTEDMLRAGDIWQTWTGGPSLLDEDGAAIGTFNCERSLYSRAARTAIGFYEPGHYVFVCADGSANDHSRGITLRDLSSFFAELGCTSAYALSSGTGSAMATQARIVSTVKADGRAVGDILFLSEPILDEP